MKTAAANVWIFPSLSLSLSLARGKATCRPLVTQECNVLVYAVTLAVYSAVVVTRGAAAPAALD